MDISRANDLAGVTFVLAIPTARVGNPYAQRVQILRMLLNPHNGVPIAI